MATFGKPPPIGGTESTFAQNYVISCRYTLSEAGSVTKISAYIKRTTAGTIPVTCAIYDHDAVNNEPENRKGVSAEVVIGDTFSWVDFVFSPAIELVAGIYHLCWNAGGVSATGCYDAGAANQYCWKSSAYPNFPDPYDGKTGGTAWAISIYATYTVPTVGGETKSLMVLTL